MRGAWNLIPLGRDQERNIDFVTPISLQSKISPRLEICHLVASGSMSSSQASQLPSSSRDMTFARSDTRINTVHAIFNAEPPDGLNLADMPITTAPEIYEDLRNLGFEDAVMWQRVCIHKMPPHFDHLPEFAEVDTFFEKQTRTPYRTRDARKRFGTYVWNPYHTIKSQLLISKLVTGTSDKVLRRIKSGLVTSWLKPTDTNLGTTHFGTRACHLLEELNKDPDDWWLDTGVPQTMHSRFDSVEFNLRLFQLKKYYPEPMAFAIEF